MFQAGNRVRIVSGPWASDCGMIRKVTRGILKIELDSGGPGLALVDPMDVQIIENTDVDYCGTMGIGGIGIHAENEMPVTPSPQAIERIQRMHDTDIICRRCGASKNFDGAMFTTGGGDTCDDCF